MQVDHTQPNMLVALLLEDQPLIAMDVGDILQRAGFEVTTVSSCTEALEWLEVSRPHVVIVDIILRDGPCHAVVQQLVDDGIPFVVHSGDPRKMHADTAFGAGTWLNKPADPDELVATVRSLVAT